MKINTYIQLPEGDRMLMAPPSRNSGGNVLAFVDGIARAGHHSVAPQLDPLIFLFAPGELEVWCRSLEQRKRDASVLRDGPQY